MYYTPVRSARLDANLLLPIERIRKENLYGRNVHYLQAAAEILVSLTDADLIDFADEGCGHFGGMVERTSGTTVTVTVWID